MQPSQVLLQYLKVYPVSPHLMHLKSKTICSPARSYSELRKRILCCKNQQLYCTYRHLYSSPGYFRLQAGMGDFSSRLATLYSRLPSMSTLQGGQPGRVALTKMPESEITQRESGLFSSPLMQLLQQMLAIPPTESPVSTTFSASESWQFSCSHLKWERVLSDPRKYSKVSLQDIGSSLWPWCKVPSQYQMMILVHVANRLCVGSVERYPPELVNVGQLYLLDPIQVLLQPQQLQMIQPMLQPEQRPKPQKKMRSLERSPPQWMQSGGGEPSRHLALRSVVCIMSLQGYSLQHVWVRRRDSKTMKSPISFIILQQ